MKKKILTIKEYAAECKVSASTIYSRINNGDISCIKIRGTLFIDTEKTPKTEKKKLGRPFAVDLI